MSSAKVLFALALFYICHAYLRFPRNNDQPREAYVTLATNDEYSIAALVMAESLKLHNTTKEMVILTTTAISPAVETALNRVFNRVIKVDEIDSKDTVNLHLLNRPELGITFSKFHCYSLEEYSKCAFVDADALALKNIDDIFEYDDFSAAPDIGWPDCFNSGVYVFTPSNHTFEEILKFSEGYRSFDGGDQGLFNLLHPEWRTSPKKQLPIWYNCPSHIGFLYKDAYRIQKDNIKVVHFLGPMKPWKSMDDMGSDDPRLPFKNFWWKVFKERVVKDFEGTDLSQVKIMAPGILHDLHHGRNSDDRRRWYYPAVNYRYYYQ